MMSKTSYLQSLILILASFFCTYHPADARTFYVIQAIGNDNNTGTELEPFKSLQKAISAMSYGDTCMIGEGIYRESVKLPSGVTILAISGTNPILTGTIDLDAIWSVYSGNIYMVDVSKLFDKIDLANYQVFVDGKAIVEARYPNLPTPYIESMMDYKRAVCQSGTNSCEIVAASSLPRGILSGAILTIWPGENGLSGWAAYSSTVEGTSGDTIGLTSPIGNGKIDTVTGGNVYDPVCGDPFYLSGSLGLLDAPGEYFLNTETKKLFVFMPDGDSPQNHRIDLRGKSLVIKAQNVSNITIKGLDIYGSGVSFKDVSNLDLEDCSIKYADHVRSAIGYTSADSMLQSVIITGQNILVKKCEFGPTACTGVRIGGKNIVFTDNIVHDCNYLGVDYAAVSVAGGTENAKISYNTIYNSGRSLVYFDADTSYKRCVIENNYMKECSTLTSDCGAFYTYGSDGGGTQIRYNFVEPGNKNDQDTMTKLREGLYVDNYSKNFLIHHNIIVGGVSAIRTNIPDTNTACYNNTVIGSEYGYGIYGFAKDNASMSLMSFRNNLFVNLQKSDIDYWAGEDNTLKKYFGRLVDGQVPVPSDIQRRPKSENNVSINGKVDSDYRFVGNMPPDVGAVEKGNKVFKYGADWRPSSVNMASENQLPGFLLISRHLRVRFVDNSIRINSVDYSPLPGYNGIASLVYTGQERDIFAPAGLDYESCSTVPKMGERADLWNAPRVAPLTIEQVNDSTVRLAQRGSDAAGLNVEIVFHLGDDYVDQTITTWPDSDIQSSSTFWASYMLFVQNTSLYLHGTLAGMPRAQWLEMTSAGHSGSGSGTYFRPLDPEGKNWYDFLSDNPVRRQAIFETPASRKATEKAGFKLANLTSLDNFFFGFVDNYVALWILRQSAKSRFNPWISASGAQALRRPAWDFAIESGPQKAGERRTFYIRFVYKPYAGLNDLMREVEHFQFMQAQ